jgi:acetyl-CoA carboxylase biotin carboxyl carrier protein
MTGLTRDDIDHILKLIDGSDFDHLKLEMGDLKLELRKPGATLPAPSSPVAAAPATAPTAAAALEMAGHQPGISDPFQTG